MTWFDLTGDARLGACATENCGQQPIYRLEADGVGSNYCSACRAKIETTPPLSEGRIGEIRERHERDSGGEICPICEISHDYDNIDAEQAHADRGVLLNRITELESALASVQSREREACAEVADLQAQAMSGDDYECGDPLAVGCCDLIAKSIRSRATKEG